MPEKYTIAAQLKTIGIGITEINNQFIFAGYSAAHGFTDIATFDGFTVAMQQAPRVVAALIESYLRVAQSRGSFHV